jgi:hypothetical protein
MTSVSLDQRRYLLNRIKDERKPNQLELEFGVNESLDGRRLLPTQEILASRALFSCVGKRSIPKLSLYYSMMPLTIVNLDSQLVF